MSQQNLYTMAEEHKARFILPLTYEPPAATRDLLYPRSRAPGPGVGFVIDSTEVCGADMCVYLCGPTSLGQSGDLLLLPVDGWQKNDGGCAQIWPSPLLSSWPPS